MVKIHDRALEYENSLYSDLDMLTDYRCKMKKKEDIIFLLPCLNALQQDIEFFREWIMEQRGEQEEKN